MADKPKKTLNTSLSIVLALILMIVVFTLSIIFGSNNVDVQTIIEAITHYDETNQEHNVIVDIRLPRIFGALLVGIALAVAGAGIQSVTRNSLADPGLIGLNAGASVMLAVTYAFVDNLSFPVLIMMSFIGAIVGGSIVLLIGRSTRDGFNPIRLILAGAAVSALLSALAQAVTIYFRISQSIIYWTAGGVSATNWQQVAIGASVVIVAVILFLLLSRQLTIMSLGDSLALGLGQNVKAVRMFAMLLSMLLAGVAVAIVGQIAFVGLMVPHIARFLVGTDYRKVIPMTAILGATLVMGADTVARMMGEAPIGAIISFIGVPYFLYLIKRGARTI